MNYTDVKNLVWTSADKTAVICQVLFEGQSEYFPFGADPRDVEAHGVQIYSECVSGKWGPIQDYVAPVRLPNTAESNKSVASQLLADTDWAMVPDVADAALSNPYLTNKADFIAYRNLLRATFINPVVGNLSWPNKPTAVWSV